MQIVRVRVGGKGKGKGEEGEAESCIGDRVGGGSEVGWVLFG